MSAGILIDNQIDIPPGIDTLDAFRRWVHSDDFPEHGRIDWVAGKLEIEMAPDNLQWHTSPKTEIGATLHTLAKGVDLGPVYIDKTRIVLPDSDVGSEPDVVLVTHDALESGRVVLVPTTKHEEDSFIEIEGPPDLVVEVVSDRSVVKDTQRLFERYCRGGVREYWLVDARGPELSFQIFTLRGDQYVPAETDRDGYQRSEVFGLRFSFSRTRGRNNLWRYDLAEKG
jgi:Uma2 family endonuclease